MQSNYFFEKNRIHFASCSGMAQYYEMWESGQPIHIGLGEVRVVKALLELVFHAFPGKFHILPSNPWYPLHAFPIQHTCECLACSEKPWMPPCWWMCLAKVYGFQGISLVGVSFACNTIVSPSYDILHAIEVCELAKHKSVPLPMSNKISTSPFHLVHTDVWGPSNVLNISGAKWFFTFIDDCTRITRHFLLNLWILMCLHTPTKWNC